MLECPHTYSSSSNRPRRYELLVYCLGNEVMTYQLVLPSPRSWLATLDSSFWTFNLSPKTMLVGDILSSQTIYPPMSNCAQIMYGTKLVKTTHICGLLEMPPCAKLRYSHWSEKIGDSLTIFPQEANPELRQGLHMMGTHLLAYLKKNKMTVRILPATPIAVLRIEGSTSGLSWSIKRRACWSSKRRRRRLIGRDVHYG